VNLEVKGGIHAIMGPNGSGKSTFSKVLAGHPAYEVTGGEVIFRAGNLLKWNRKNEPGWRVSGVSVPFGNSGVSNLDFACGILRKQQGLRN